MNFIQKIFGKNKPIIGMLHLDCLLGDKQFKGLDYVVERAKRDIDKLQKGGIEGIIIENWKENSTGEFISPETAVSYALVCEQIAHYIKVPFGINVLNNDYKVAFSIAKLVGASFIELDVLVDDVISDFSHSDVGQKNPFEIKINPRDVFDYAKKIQAEDIPVFCFVQPKHYLMLNKNKTIEQSIEEAENAGAAAILITKATGMAPTVDLIKKAKSASKKIPVGIGSGFSIENAKDFLPFVDFVVVGSALKISGDADNEVDEKSVHELMKFVHKNRE